MATYVMQQPNSNSNPTDKYQVVTYRDWMLWFGGYATSVPVVSSFDTYEEGMAERDRLNMEAFKVQQAEVEVAGVVLAQCGCPYQVILDLGHQEGCEVLRTSIDTA